MGRSITERITNKLVINDVITTDNKELYRFGLQQGILMIFNIATFMGIGIVLNMVWESIIFLLTFIPLRSNAGGYHAKTQVKCYLYSVAR